MKSLQLLPLLIAALYASAPAGGQDLSVGAAEQFMLVNKHVNNLITGPKRFETFDARLIWKTAGCEAATLYNSPRLGIGFSYADLGRLVCTPGSSIGDSFTLYGLFERDIVRLGPVSAGYSLELGAALMTRPYHKTDNPANTLYAGPFTFHFRAGLFVLAQVSPKWAVGVEAAYRHNSSARFFIPNSGINSIGGSLNVRYSLSESTLAPGGGKSSEPGQPLDAPFRVALVAGGGIHRCMAEFNADKLLPPLERQDSYTPWFKGSIAAEAVWRYCRRTSSGIKVQLQYLGNIEALRRSDEAIYGSSDYGYFPLAPGAALIQDIYFGPVTAGIGLGVYLYKAVGKHEYHGPIYQEVSLRYYPPAIRSFFFGATLRAHTFNQVDYLEFTLGKIL